MLVLLSHQNDKAHLPKLVVHTWAMWSLDVPANVLKAVSHHEVPREVTRMQYYEHVAYRRSRLNCDKQGPVTFSLVPWVTEILQCVEGSTGAMRLSYLLGFSGNLYEIIQKPRRQTWC